jgi:hypothetical protein
MSTTLSKGYKQPDTGDRGTSWFADLNFDITRINAHNHDGSNSEAISVNSITKSTATIAAASWGADLGGSSYKQTITLPTGFSFDDTILKFIISGGADDGQLIYPTVIKQSSTTFDVYINDNTQTLKVIYG